MLSSACWMMRSRILGKEESDPGLGWVCGLPWMREEVQSDPLENAQLDTTGERDGPAERWRMWWGLPACLLTD